MADVLPDIFSLQVPKSDEKPAAESEAPKKPEAGPTDAPALPAGYPSFAPLPPLAGSAPQPGAETAEPPAVTAEQQADVVKGLFGLEEAPMGVGEFATTAAKVATGESVRFGTAVAGMTAGAAAGAAGGPFAPFTVPAGAIIGLGLGYFAGDSAADELEKHGIALAYEGLSPRQKPAGVAGSIIGGGITGSGAAGFFANTGRRLAPSLVGRYINRMLDTARDMPRSFYGAEVAGTGFAAGAGAGFEASSPDQPLLRTGVEIAAGMFSPVRWAVIQSRRILEFGYSTFSQFSRTARLGKAGKVLRDVFDKSGGDPDLMMAMLLDDSVMIDAIPGFTGTAGMRTGNPFIQAIEAELREINRPFGEESLKRAQDSLEATSRMILLLRGSGSPDALQLAARLERESILGTVEQAKQTAELQMLEAGRKIVENGGGKQSLSQLSKQAVDIYSNSLEMVRKTESDLWGEALKDVAQPSNWGAVFRMASNLKGEMSLAANLPKFISDELSIVNNARTVLKFHGAGTNVMPDGSKITKKMVTQAQKALSVGELIKFRRDLLALARGASRSTDEMAPQNARMYGLLAEAVLNDLVNAGAATKSVEGGVAATLRGSGGRFTGEMTAYDRARAFSSAVNDTYSRSFIGAAGAKGAFGQNFPPETVLRAALAGPDERVALRMMELEEAARFLPMREFGDDEALAAFEVNAQDMFDVQSRLWRSLADGIGISDGKPDIKRLQKFMTEHGEVLGRFPEVKKDLDEAVSSAENFKAWSDRFDETQKLLKRDVTARVLDVDSPSQAIRGALGSGQPITRLQEMVDLARASNQPEAIDGLRSSIFDYMAEASTRKDGTIDLGSLLNVLDKPVRPGLPSLQEFMADNGLLDAAAADSLERYKLVITNILQSLGTRPVGETLIPNAGPLTDLLIRVSGSEAARRALAALAPQGGSSGPTLIAAYRGSQAFQDLFNRMPRKKLQGFLIEALEGGALNPGSSGPDGKPFTLLEAMLKTYADGGKAMRKAMQLHSYLWTSAFLGAQDEREQQLNPADDRNLSPTERMLFGRPPEEVQEQREERPSFMLPGVENFGVPETGE